MPQKDELVNKIIFKKYKIIKLLYSGLCSKVYEGISIITNKPVALKLESRSPYTPKLVERECSYLITLKFQGIPNVLSCGRTKQYNILILELLGNSLEKLYSIKKFNIKDICMIGLQIIDRLEYIHSKNIIHRDIKPANFLVSCEDPSFIYIIDFGLARKYRSSQTLKHIPYCKVKKLFGNFRYISVNGLKFMEQSRRDDLESLCYMLIEFAKGSLPWTNCGGKTSNEVYYRILKIKTEMKEEILCENLPNEFLQFLKYTKRLKFAEEPNYNYLRGLLNTVLNKIAKENDLDFSWINKNDIKIKSLDDRKKRIKLGRFSLSKKKMSPFVKLLKQIEKSPSKDNKQRKKEYSENNIVFGKYFKKNNLNSGKYTSILKAKTEENLNITPKDTNIPQCKTKIRKLNVSNQISSSNIKRGNRNGNVHKFFVEPNNITIGNSSTINLKHNIINILKKNEDNERNNKFPIKQFHLPSSEEYVDKSNCYRTEDLINSSFLRRQYMKNINFQKELNINNRGDLQRNSILGMLKNDDPFENNFNVLTNKNDILYNYNNLGFEPKSSVYKKNSYVKKHIELKKKQEKFCTEKSFENNYFKNNYYINTNDF